jgi:hypothetical protein
LRAAHPTGRSGPSGAPLRGEVVMRYAGRATRVFALQCVAIVDISANNIGFVHHGSTTPWCDVRAIATYKDDLFAYDEIWLAFKTGDHQWVEVSEHEEGFHAFIEDVSRRFSLPDGWFGDVMHPAFARNARVLWGVADLSEIPNPAPPRPWWKFW